MASINDALTVRVKSIEPPDSAGNRLVALDLEPDGDPRVQEMLFVAKISNALWEQSCADLKPEDFCVVELGPYKSSETQALRSIRRVDCRALQAGGKGVH